MSPLVGILEQFSTMGCFQGGFAGGDVPKCFRGGLRGATYPTRKDSFHRNAPPPNASPEECTEQIGGSIKCWGANNYGQMGDSTTDDRLTPVAPRGRWDRVASRTDPDACTLVQDLFDQVSG